MTVRWADLLVSGLLVIADLAAWSNVSLQFGVLLTG